MSIKQLRSYIGQVNIAKEISEDKLTELGQRVKRQFDEDYETMNDWIESVENGIDLMKQEWNPKSTPWQGASNYKDPLLTEAAIRFGDRASLELLRGKDLVAFEIVGRDPQGKKKALGERISEAMNYQINHDMSDWRTDQERLFYTLPNTGCLFKKTIYDPIEEKAESHIIQFPDFVVNQATKTMLDCRSFSHVLDVSYNDAVAKIRAGRWVDIDLQSYNSEAMQEGDKGSNEAEKVASAMENPCKFIEQQCYFDLDDDGYEEPYIVTIQESSCKVVRVIARFDERSIKVKYDGRVMDLRKALEVAVNKEVMLFGGASAVELVGIKVPEVDPDKEMELLKIIPFQQITKYGFIPAPDGTFLDLGYAHLLGAIVQSINTSTNQLTDRGTLNNVGGGFLSKEFRKEMGINRMRIGQWIKTEVPADKLASGVFPNPTQEPSATLYALNEKMQNRGQQFLAIADVSGQINAQTAPTTALAIIQEGMIPTSALFKRILRAETNEFNILLRLNQRTFDPAKYQMILDDPSADAESDFNAEGLDIIPTANAEMSSKMQRTQVAALQLDQFDRILQTGGNPVPVLKDYFENIGSDILEQIYPEEGSMSPAEQKQLDGMRQAQETANQIQQAQLQILQREQDRLDAETRGKLEKIGQEVKSMQVEILKTIATAMKTMEEAESENLKNKVTTYTANLQAKLDEVLAIGAISNVGFIPQSFAQPPAGNIVGAVPGMASPPMYGSAIR
jgi:chaperonin GroES